MDIADQIWHRALAPEFAPELRAGDRSLAAVLEFHGRVMNGGVLHVVESSTAAYLDTVEAACRWLGIAPVADLVEAVRERVREGVLDDDDMVEALEVSADADYKRVVATDAELEQVVRRRVAADPESFASI